MTAAPPHEPDRLAVRGSDDPAFDAARVKVRRDGTSVGRATDETGRC